MIDYIVNNTDQFVSIADTLVTLFLAVAALTPTEADDTIAARVKNLVNKGKTLIFWRKVF